MMTHITAKVIEASSNGSSTLWTFQLKYPRFIHSEFMTHCMISKSASSSRAIPVAKMLSQVWNDPAAPIHWGKNQKGMQAKEQLTGWRLALGKFLWNTAGKVACCFVYVIDKLGGHKQWANRLLEPWQYIHVIATGTEWANFFELRDHEDAQPEFRKLAIAMRCAMNNAIIVDRSAPTQEIGYWHGNEEHCWHLPYITAEERRMHPVKILAALSTARCARVSYLTHDGKVPSFAADLQLYHRLVGSVPKHASPTEHQACVAPKPEAPYYKLRGFMPHRWLADKSLITRPAPQPEQSEEAK